VQRQVLLVGQYKYRLPRLSRESAPTSFRLSSRCSPISCPEAGAWKNNQYVPRMPRSVFTD